MYEKIDEPHQLMYESERYLKAIIESSMDGLLVVDDLGRFEFGNDAVFSIFGWPKGELIGQFFMKIIPEDLTDFMLERWTELQNGIERPYETRIFTKNGDIRHLHVTHSHTVIERKRKYVVVIKDITENKKLQKGLENSEARYRDLFDNAEDPMYTIDNQGFIRTINKSGIKILGSDKEEIIGSHISKWLTPESLKSSMDTLQKQMSGESKEETVLIEVVTKDGTHKWGESKTRILKDGDTITGVHGIVRDITEKIKLEQELKESEAKYRDLFDNAQDAMYVLNKEAIVLKMNRIGLEILECTIDEVIGKSIFKWLTPESIKIVEERTKKCLAGEPLNRTDEIEMVCKNCEHRWIEIKTRLIMENGKLIEIHGIGRDITENKKLRQKLNNSNKQRKLLCYLIKGTRGGETRALILKNLSEKSYNANQLSNILKMDYKTVRYHLDILIKNDIINMDKKGNSSAIYFISGKVSADLTDL